MNMTITGTVTALVILLIKVILKDKLAPKWHAAIWLILAVRLLVPGLPESDMSVFNAVPRVGHIDAAGYVPDAPSGDIQEAAATAAAAQESLNLKVPVTGVVRDEDFTVKKQSTDLLLFGWVAGAAVMAVCLVGSSAVFGRRVRKLPLYSDPALLNLFEECKKAAGVKSGRISLRRGGNTPMLLGIRKPVILIPEKYGCDELRHVLLHELCHYKHKDIWINILCCFLLSVYWFNPVFWLCFFIIRRDLEILCDYRVVEITGERKAYAAVLLRTALEKNQFIFATTSLQNGEKEVARRIRSLAYFKKPKLWVSAAAVVIILAVTVLCLTNGTLNRTVILDAGEGYFFKIPESWEAYAVQDIHDGPELYTGYTVFHDKEGNPFGGIDMLGVDMTPYMNPSALRQQGIPYDEIDYETVELPWPNHSRVLSRAVIRDLLPFPVIVVNLERDSETAAQEAERNASGDTAPSKKINQTHIFFWPDPTWGRVFDLWADSDKVPEDELLEIAKTFQKEVSPRSYRPEASFAGDWEETAERLLNDYFQNYADAEMTKASDISGYTIKRLESHEDREASWSVIYPDAEVFRVDYTLDVAYPDQYAFAGGGFEIGEGKRTKIFKDQLAVFQKIEGDRAVFLGFVMPQNAAEMGETMTIISILNNAGLEEKAAALIDAKTPYIGDNSRVGQLAGLMPLAEYFSGLELQTKDEPYGMTVNYDLTKMGNLIFEGGEERAPADSRGWDVNPYLKAQLFQNAAMLLSLVDNAGVVSLSVQGISETGIPYTYIYRLDRVTLNEKFAEDARLSTESVESYCRFLRALEESQMDPAKDTVYQTKIRQGDVHEKKQYQDQ